MQRQEISNTKCNRWENEKLKLLKCVIHDVSFHIVSMKKPLIFSYQLNWAMENGKFKYFHIRRSAPDDDVNI